MFFHTQMQLLTFQLTCGNLYDVKISSCLITRAMLIVYNMTTYQMFVAFLTDIIIEMQSN